jgi:exoribonuclease II
MPAPAPAQVMEGARAMREELDLDFLWEVAGDAEFGFESLAQDYFGRKPDRAGGGRHRLALHQAPIYFQKKGKGRYKAAPAETLAAAKLGLERKAREAALRAEWVAHAGARRIAGCDSRQGVRAGAQAGQEQS